MNQSSLPKETILNARYKVIRTIGQGGFGITYLAHHIELNKNVAIKECYVQQWCVRDNNFVCAYENRKARFEEFKIKFLKEAQTLAKLDHKNIVTVTDYFEGNGTAYFVMEYIEGESLLKVIERMDKLDEDYAINIIVKLSKAVDFLHHRKILHRDIKPDNIIIDANEEPILLDFGAARELAGNQMPHTVIQTPGYAPIEQYNPNSPKGFYIDIYSVGATFYHLLTGQKPVPAQQRIVQDNLIAPHTINPKISAVTSKVILKAMAVKHFHRYQTVGEFIQALNPSRALISAGVDTEDLTTTQLQAFEELRNFSQQAGSQIFILNGASNSGKSFLIIKLINFLNSLNIPVMLLASTGKIAEGIRSLNNYERIQSLYATIYNFNEANPIISSDETTTSSEDSDDQNIEKIRLGLRRNNDDEKIIYIVDNSELVSDNYNEFDLYIFGSGMLLNDFINYTGINNDRSKRKIIFVGDDKQLLLGSRDLSSLSARHLKQSFGFTVDSFNLSEPYERRGFDLINKNLANLKNGIEKELYNNLEFSFDDSSFINLAENDLIEEYNKLSPQDTIILVFTNTQAKYVNGKIRKLLGRKHYIEKGDRVLLHNNIDVIDEFNQSFHFANGEFAEVMELFDRVSEIVYFKGKGRKGIKLDFRKIRLKFETTDKEIDLLMFENFFTSDDREIDENESVGLHILANKKFGELSNQEKLELLKSFAFLKGLTDLTEFENNVKLDKKDFNKFLRSRDVFDDIRKYFLRRSAYLNAAKLRFGYCITCHKAQGFKWPNVIINCETNQSKTNENYFRWLYTGLTRTTSKIFVVNPPIIKPTLNLKLADTSRLKFDQSADFVLIPGNFINLEEVSNEPDFPDEKPELIVFYNLVLTSIANTSYKVKNVIHNAYQELYHIEVNGRSKKIQISYNGKFHFKKPHSTDEEAKKFIDLVFSIKEIVNFPANYLKDFYYNISNKLKPKNISISSIEHGNNAETYTLNRGSEILTSIIYYTADQFFTTVMVQKTNSENLLNDFKEIIETKLL